MAEKDKKINSLIDASVLTLGDLADVDTVVGKPIVTASGFQVIPFSKVTMGCLSGGGEYGDIKVVKEANSMPFAGGSGSVVSMKPMGFIIDDGKSCRMVRITDEPIDNLIEKASEIVRNITAKEYTVRKRIASRAASVFFAESCLRLIAYVSFIRRLPYLQTPTVPPLLPRKRNVSWRQIREEFYMRETVKKSSRWQARRKFSRLLRFSNTATT